MLLVAAVAGGSLLAGLRLGSFFAALGTVALFAALHDPSPVLEDRADAGGYTQVALLGLAIFAVSITAALLARRARESEALAEERGLDVANLEALSAHIVQRLDTGVIALDRDGRIRLANRLANRIIGAVEAIGARRRSPSARPPSTGPGASSARTAGPAACQSPPAATSSCPASCRWASANAAAR
ncbi:MAG: hypothetical protein U5L11_08030 [Arhodomonas sp.]|nr:hypothetical protein [Arhodomonas sp.]